jgi:hypothetical protein
MEHFWQEWTRYLRVALFKTGLESLKKVRLEMLLSDGNESSVVELVWSKNVSGIAISHT